MTGQISNNINVNCMGYAAGIETNPYLLPTGSINWVVGFHEHWSSIIKGGCALEGNGGGSGAL